VTTDLRLPISEIPASVTLVTHGFSVGDTVVFHLPRPRWWQLRRLLRWWRTNGRPFVITETGSNTFDLTALTVSGVRDGE
jgi:hypothetical protein